MVKPVPGDRERTGLHSSEVAQAPIVVVANSRQQFNYPEASREFVMAAFNTPAPAESEDCLTVNVFVPAGSEVGGELKPVMFWIYGGSLQFGWNGIAAYDGSSFAINQDVIVVATNYRTNGIYDMTPRSRGFTC